jgi:hypothetical protein
MGRLHTLSACPERRARGILHVNFLLPLFEDEGCARLQERWERHLKRKKRAEVCKALVKTTEEGEDEGLI